MKMLKKIKQQYKKAVRKHRKAKKAYLKAKARGMKNNALIKLWKKWQQAKYNKKAIKLLVHLEKAETEIKTKANKASAKSDEDKKNKIKMSKRRIALSSIKKKNEIAGKVPIHKTSKPDLPKKTTIPHRPMQQDAPSASRTSTVKPEPSLHPEDLKKVEGIGPKIEQILYAAGIKTWQSLAESTDAKLRHILAEAGPRFRMHNPDSWPSQARLAEQGKWLELKKLQEKFKKQK